jgi:hypothetical protein
VPGSINNAVAVVQPVTHAISVLSACFSLHYQSAARASVASGYKQSHGNDHEHYTRYLAAALWCINGHFKITPWKPSLCIKPLNTSTTHHTLTDWHTSCTIVCQHSVSLTMYHYLSAAWGSFRSQTGPEQTGSQTVCCLPRWLFPAVSISQYERAEQPQPNLIDERYRRHIIINRWWSCRV